MRAPGTDESVSGQAVEQIIRVAIGVEDFPRGSGRDDVCSNDRDVLARAGAQFREAVGTCDVWGLITEIPIRRKTDLLIDGDALRGRTGDFAVCETQHVIVAGNDVRDPARDQECTPGAGGRPAARCGPWRDRYFVAQAEAICKGNRWHG